MLEKSYENGAVVFKVTRSNKGDLTPPPEIIYGGKIKAIIIPISIRTPNHKKYKKQELHLCFSALKTKKDYSAKIKKDFNFLYKNGTYAPGTHLIPMSVKERAPIDDMFKNAYLKFSMPCGPMPGTATISDRVDFFPCHDDVQEMMMKHFDYPDFFITLLPTTALLNIKTKSSKKVEYQRVLLKHTSGQCNHGVGYSFIHVVEDRGNIGISLYKQIKWDTFEFEEDEFDSPWNAFDQDNYIERYIDFK
ncbi:MAG: hypothetical protein ACOYL3_16450 [Desulfuromonadaceae bacterium]